MFTASLNILCFTLPSNVSYIADYLANSAQFLDHPVPYYSPQNHYDHPAYYNPHNPPPEGFRALRRNKLDALMGRGVMQQQQKTIDVQRQQVDQVFQALPSHDELPETAPDGMIKTNLFPHQLKAITFLQRREQEPSAIKAAMALRDEASPEIVDVDAEEDEDKKKQARKLRRKAEKDVKKKGVNSLWEPQYDSSGKKIKSWKHMVTEQVEKVKEKPEEARAAILADEMGLGKTLSIVSLIASTLNTARKFGQGSIRDPAESDSSSDEESEEVDPTHFTGAVFGMPSANASSDELDGPSVKAGRKRKRGLNGFKFGPTKIAKLERKGRLDRLQSRSRATLLVCPLSTVSNWEDQIRDHWNGGIYVVGGGGAAGVDKGKKAEKAGPEKGDLKVYIYHGNSRKNDIAFLADFDIVITTFSVLQTEYSKQIKTSEGDRGYVDDPSASATASTSIMNTPLVSDDDAPNPFEVDEQGQMRSEENPDLRRERLALQRTTTANTGKKKNKNIDMDLFGKVTTREVVSPLQAVEWFRVVLDEAQ